MTDWISVEDRLPEYSEQVITYSKPSKFNRLVTTGRRKCTDGTGEVWQREDGWEGIFEPTHWMPLPSPPGEQE